MEILSIGEHEIISKNHNSSVSLKSLSRPAYKPYAGTDAWLPQPNITLPGHVWQIRKSEINDKANDTNTSRESDKWPLLVADGKEQSHSSIIIETTEDLSSFLGFTAGKSKLLWLEVSSPAFITSDLGIVGGNVNQEDQSKVFSNDNRNISTSLSQLNGGLPMTESKPLLQAVPMIVKSVTPHSIEVTGSYTGPPIEKGWPLVRFRSVGGVPLSTSATTAIGLAGPTNTAKIISTNIVELPAAVSGSVVVTHSHPAMPYALAGLSDGNVLLISA